MMPVDVPLFAGVDESTDKALLPAGPLRQLHNYRLEKPGRAVRRGGYSYISTERALRAGETTSGTRWMIAEDDDSASTLYTYDGGANLRAADGEFSSLVSAPIPFFRDRLQITATYDASNARNPVVAANGGYVLAAVVFDRIGGTQTLVHYTLTDLDGNVIEEAALSGNRCDVIASGNYLILFTSTNFIITRHWVDVTAVSPSLGGSFIVADTIDSSAPTWAVSHDTIGTGGTYAYFLAYNYDWASVTNTTVVRSSDDSTGNQTDTISTECGAGVSVAGSTGTAVIVMINSVSTGGLYAYAWETSLAGTGPKTGIALVPGGVVGGAFTVHCDSSTAWAAWVEESTPSGYSRNVQDMKWCTLDPVANTAGTIRSRSRCAPNSRPCGPGGRFLWTQYGYGSFGRQYMLTEFADAIEQLEFSATAGYGVGDAWQFDPGTETMDHPIGGAYDDENGDYYYAAIEVYDGDITLASGAKKGLVVYRYSHTSRRRACTANLGGVHIAGGRHRLFDGQATLAVPYCAPEADSSWLTAQTGAGTLNGTYYYKIVYKKVDSAGNIWRSAPSDVISVTSASNFQTRLYAEGCGEEVIAEAYRQAGDGTYRYVGEVAVQTYVSTGSGIVDDGSSIASAPLLYTEGGESASYPTPPGDVCAEFSGRLFWASADQVYYSHAYDFADGANLAPWMVGSFYLQFTDTVTGMVGLDSVLLVFTHTSVYAVTGDGPGRTGANPYLAPDAITSEVGCVDWRSVAAFRDGAVFRSGRGLEMVPRGAFAVQPIGDPVEDTLASYEETCSAVVRPTHDQIRWTVRGDTDGRVVALDYTRGVWSTETAPAYDCATMWQDDYYVGSHSTGIGYATVDGGLWAQGDAGSDDDGSGEGTADFSSTIETGQIRPFGLVGWGRVGRIEVLGRAIGATNITVSTSTSDATWSASPARAVIGTGRFRHMHSPAAHKCETIAVRIEDDGSSATSGVEVHGLTVYTKPKRRGSRLAAGERT